MLFASFNLLLATYYLLLATYYLLFATCCLPPTAYYLLFATYYLQFTYYCSCKFQNSIDSWLLVVDTSTIVTATAYTAMVNAQLQSIKC